MLPRRIQQIPGVVQGGVGWQGIIPSRAAKMGSIAVDKGIAKLGGAGDFYEQLDPEAIAEHILATARGDIREVVERIMEREHPRLWHDLPPRVRAAVHARVQEQLPDIVREITGQIGAHVDQLLDVKLMVIRRIEENPELANRIFLEVGRKELRFIVNFGFFFGFLLGIPTAFLTVEVWTMWWLLPIAGVLIGYVTNLARDLDDLRAGRAPAHRLAQRPGAVPQAPAGGRRRLRRHHRRRHRHDRQHRRGAAARAQRGPHPADDRGALRPAVDSAVGRARPAVRVAVGAREYDPIRDSVAAEAVDYDDDAAHRPGVQPGRRAAASASSSRRGCARWAPPTSPRCCARRCARTSGCSTCTAPCSASAPA